MRTSRESPWGTLTRLVRGRPPRGLRPVEVVELDVALLVEGGLYETPAGWRGRLATMGLQRSEIRGLPGNGALLDVLGARRDSVWRRHGWRWFGLGVAVSVVVALGIAFGLDKPDYAIAFLFTYGLLLGFIGFLVGRWRYDQHRSRVVERADTAMAAVDRHLQEAWVDALKVLALAPCAARRGDLVVDGTTPARRSLAAWSAVLRRFLQRCQGWKLDAEAGLEMVGDLAAVAGARASTARAELYATQASVHRLEQDLAALIDRVDGTDRELRKLSEELRRSSSEVRCERDLRPLFEELARIDAQVAALERDLGRRDGGDR